MALSDQTARSGQTDRPIAQGECSLSERPNEPLNANPERRSAIVSNINDLDRSPTLNERPARSAHERVLSALRAKDGVLFGSQVALGAAFGWSKTRLHEVLHELQAAGRVRLSVSRLGHSSQADRGHSLALRPAPHGVYYCPVAFRGAKCPLVLRGETKMSNWFVSGPVDVPMVHKGAARFIEETSIDELCEACP